VLKRLRDLHLLSVPDAGRSAPRTSWFNTLLYSDLPIIDYITRHSKRLNTRACLMTPSTAQCVAIFSFVGNPQMKTKSISDAN
jgi:hypothetical protein